MIRKYNIIYPKDNADLITRVYRCEIVLSYIAELLERSLPQVLVEAVNKEFFGEEEISDEEKDDNK